MLTNLGRERKGSGWFLGQEWFDWTAPGRQMAQISLSEPPGDSLLLDGLQEVQGWLDLLLGVGGLHGGAGDGDVLALRRHVVGRGDHAHVDVCGDRDSCSPRAPPAPP